ncbi:hypothetical protein E4T43_08680 [Aureobasidium subglaciale]|nr:hypothetical protein E4T43_08680 [Aureobasidium subglaciale]
MSTNITNITLTVETCRDLMVLGAKPEVDTEISGIGAILAFLLSAYVTFAIVLISYLLGSIDRSLLRPVDLYVHRLPSQRRTSPSWHKALQQCVLLLSDQQIVTGIAVCIAGFIALRGHISVYHFQIVIMLAWMSSSVHLSALTMLGEYFHKRPGVLGWRIVGMLILFVLLLVALVPTSSNLWATWYLHDDTKDDDRTYWAIPAKCFYFHTWGEGINPDAPLSYLILIGSYIWKIGALFKTSRNIFHRRIRGPYEYFLERILHAEALKVSKRREKQKSLTWKYHVVMVVYVVLLALFEFGASFAASLWLSYVGLVYGTIQIIIPRQQNFWWNHQENKWTFGQIVPLVLLTQPVGAVLENFKVRGHKRKTGRDSIASEDGRDSGSASNSVMLPPRDVLARHEQTFSEMFAALEVIKPNERSFETLDHQMPFYTSVVFTTIILWIQVGIAIISSVAFWIDSISLGYVTSDNWYYVGIGLGGFVAAIHHIIIVIVVVMNPPFQDRDVRIMLLSLTNAEAPRRMCATLQKLLNEALPQATSFFDAPNALNHIDQVPPSAIVVLDADLMDEQAVNRELAETVRDYVAKGGTVIIWCARQLVTDAQRKQQAHAFFSKYSMAWTLGDSKLLRSNVVEETKALLPLGPSSRFLPSSYLAQSLHLNNVSQGQLYLPEDDSRQISTV